MRRVGRVIGSLFLIVVLATAIVGGVLAARWLQAQGVFEGALARQPEQPVALSSLGRYTRQAAGTASFRRYFTTMVFPEPGGPAGPPTVVAKWERPEVVIRLENPGAPGIPGYLRQVVRRLDRLQRQVTFVLGGGDPQITIRFLTADTYLSTVGPGSVGNTRTRYYTTSPGLISASIAINVQQPGAPDSLKSTLIHELTHAIGCSGHFHAASDRRRSVLFESGQLTAWSQSDAAVIRLLYSPWIRSGMTEAQAQAALRSFAKAAK